MELSAINDKLVQQIQRAQVESVVAVTKALGLKTGSQFLAEVGKVAQATPEERAQLVKAIEANLLQINKNSAAPAVKALVNQLLEQRSLAQTPGVKLVNLTVTPPVTSTASAAAPPAPVSLLSYTSLPVQPGQTLLMQIAEGQRLQVLQVLTKAEVAAFAALQQTTAAGSAPNSLLPIATSLTTTNLPGSSSLLNNSPLLTNTVATANHQIQTNNQIQTGDQAVNPKLAIAPPAMEAIGETLRRLLPQKDRGQDLMTTLPKITQFIQQLPVAERKEWLSNQLQQSLKTLANHVRIADQLSNPKMVEMALKNNGQSFEYKLAQLVTKNPDGSTLSNTSGTATTLSKTNTNNPGVVASAQAQKNLSAQSGQSQPNPRPIERMASQDLKGALLGALHHLDNELETLTPLPTSLSSASELNKTPIANALPQFLGMLMQKQQPGELSQKQLRNQLVMLMHQYTLGSLAKIQLQQLHRINHQMTHQMTQGNDLAQPTQSWQFDIPVRTGQDVTPLHIHLEQQWVEEQAGEENQNSNRVRQWNLMLGFNLPMIGQFYAQLTLLNDQLSAKFWAENENTLTAAKNKMDGLKTQLESEGIQITQMQCVPGLPPKPKLSFSYSLVDVKT
jgi:hypothetical protein